MAKTLPLPIPCHPPTNPLTQKETEVLVNRAVRENDSEMGTPHLDTEHSKVLVIVCKSCILVRYCSRIMLPLFHAICKTPVTEILPSDDDPDFSTGKK